ncbi:MAG: hypothetical protein R6V53_01080 [Candidatus Woesearchaeota archaeon]
MKKIMLFCIIFLLGWLGNNVYSLHLMPQAESPASQDFSVFDILKGSVPERISPPDRISEDQIKVYDEEVILSIKNPEWASFTDTNSMDPIIDSEANAIQVVPESPDEIQVGDIVSYKSSYAKGTIIHRVIKVGTDSKGWYAILKGDNLSKPDPEKVRFDQIKRVLVAIIY